MKLITCKSTDELAQKADQWLKEKIREGARSAFLPAGQTPKKLYALMEAKAPGVFSTFQFLQIDEITDGPLKGSFQKFFRETLPSYVSQIQWITKSATIADLALLGFGRNGHVAFHEPHIPHPFFGGAVQLSKATQSALGLQSDTHAITYGVETFLQVRACLLMVQGEGKREAFAKFLQGDPSVPASRLLNHPNLTVLVTEDISSGS